MENKVSDILQFARRKGIFISLDNEQLSIKFSKEKSIDPVLLEDIKANKKLIIAFLNKPKVKKFDLESHIVPISKDLIQRIPLSFSQERLWFIDQLEGSIQYHLTIVRRLKGNLNKKALADALQNIVARHEALRTVILEEYGQPYQFIKEAESWQIEMIDGSLYNHDPKGLEEYLQNLIQKPFNLAADYMLRAHLIVLSQSEHILLLTMHHISSDGWSVSIFEKELSGLYEVYTKERSPVLTPLPIQYADYALWERKYLQGEVLEEKIHYWKNKLEGVETLQLQTDYARPVEWSGKGASLRFNIGKLLSSQLQVLSNQQGSTLFMTLLAAFKILLHRYSGQTDICIGSPIANRTQIETENLIGFFINTLAFRSEVKSELSFKDVLQRVQITTLEAFEHQDVPFEKIVEVVVKERDLSRNPIFQVMLVMQNTPIYALPLGKVQLFPEEVIQNTAHFDITFSITETQEGLKVSVEYATDLFSEPTIKRMINHFNTLLSSIVQSPHQKIGELTMLSIDEKQLLLYEFNNTKVDYPKGKTIVDIFEEQAAKTPEAIAVVFEDAKLTYKQLNEKANQLAQYLRGKGIKEETLVPICIERSLEMIIGILGILKAGGAYIPIDPEYPEERIRYMLEDTNASLVVSSKESKTKLQKSIDFKIIELDTDWPVISTQPIKNLQTVLYSYHLVYVIYTSGSTGKPKGVMIEHGSLVNLLNSIKKEVDFKSDSRFLSVTTFSFDICYLEFYLPLITGGKLILVPREIAIDGYRLADSIADYLPTHIQGTPATWQLLLDMGWVNKEGIKILIGGEAVAETIKEQLTQLGTVFNLFGPTETTVWSSIKKLKQGEKVLIGKPLANTSIYILNDQLQLCMPSVAGEIWIGGDGLARGYLNLPELTSEKFIANPFSGLAGARLYRTGDMGRWLPDGNIEYLGRKDDQVKIRGYRIELGEIESVLQQFEGISQVVILAREDINGNKQLIGYIVSKGIFDKEAIVSYLKTRLPDYMVPALWIELEDFPLTPNGKIDKKSLPDFDVVETLNDNYVAPRNETEKMIAEIWEEVLAIEKVGVNNNFFELGGHSLVILKLVSKVRGLGLKIEVKDFFKYQTVEQQSNFIKTSLKLLNTASEGKFVIPIQPEGDNIPLFAIPEFLLYSEIGKYISKKQPFYSIEHSPNETVSEIVNHYITEIKKTHPHGPYGLMGYCAWGEVILEIARTLIAQGDEVPVLILTEYYSPEIKLSKFSKKFIGGKTKFIINNLRGNVSLNDKSKFLSKQFGHALKFIRRKITRSEKKTIVSRRDLYLGKVILFQASETYGFKDDSHMGWSEIFTGEVKKFIIEGDHLAMMASPIAAAQVAEILNEELNLIC